MYFLILTLVAAEQWNYIDSGKDWNDTCSTGKQQSPINIAESLLYKVPDDLYFSVSFDYTPINVIGGFTTDTYLVSGLFGIMSFNQESVTSDNGERGNIQQFHFHSPAENKVLGKSYDLEMHIVMLDLSKKYEYIVFATLFEVGNSKNEFIQQVIDNDGKSQNLDLASTFKVTEVKDFYVFMGSLTVPPCSQNVLWIVNKEIQTINEAQYNFFADKWIDNFNFAQGKASF